MISSWKYKDLEFSFIKESQIPEIIEILHDSEVEKYLYFAPIQIETFKSFCLPIIKQQKEASAIFVVSQKGKLLGTCGIDKMPDGHNVAMIGYQLKRSAWGTGIGTCCAEFILYYAKTYLKLRKLFGDCYAANVASGRVLEKCGFKLEAVIKGKYELNGEIHDNNWYGLNVEDIQLLPDKVIEITE